MIHSVKGRFTMHGNKRNIGQIVLKITAVLAVMVFAVPVHATTTLESEGIKKTDEGQITVKRAQDSRWPVNGTVFHLYKVADLKDDMTFAYTSAFAGKANNDILPSATITPDNSKWESSTTALMKTVADKGIAPDITASWNNTQNNVVFSNLGIGLYLLTTDPIVYNNTRYVSSGNLISVPYRASNTDPWQYAYSVEVKHTEEAVPAPSPTPTPKPTPSIKKTPKPSGSPNTGDHSHVGLYAGVFTVMVFVIGIVIGIKKEERKN